MKSTHVALLALATAIVIGTGWSIDMPQAIEVPLREDPFYYSTFQFNMLYFFTYLPMFIFDIPVGIVLDKLPVQRTIIFLVFASFMSQFLTVYLFQFRFAGYLYILYFFRAIFGVAGQGLYTVQALLISNYGKNYYQMLMGFSLCIPFLFDSLNCICTPIIYDATQSITLVWYIGSFFSLISLTCGIFIAFILKAEVKKQKQLKEALKNQIQNQNQSKSLKCQDKQKDQINKNKNYLKITLNPQTDLNNQQSYSQSIGNQNLESLNNKQQQSVSQKQQQQQEGFSFNGVKQMNKYFWVIIAAIFFTQYSVGSFIDNLNDTLVKRFQIPYVTAGQILILPYGLACIISVGLGKMLSVKPKWRRKSFFIASLSYFSGVLGLYLLPNIEKDEATPIYHFIVIVYFCVSMSFLFSQLYACLCSSIIYVVQKKYIGTAWGIVGSAMGLSESIGPLTNSLIISSGDNLSDAYTNLTLYTSALAFATLLFSIWLLVGDFSCIDTNYQTFHGEKDKDAENASLSNSLRESLLSQDNLNQNYNRDAQG